MSMEQIRAQRLLDSIATKLNNKDETMAEQRKPTLQEKAHAITHTLTNKIKEYLNSVNAEIVQKQAVLDAHTNLGDIDRLEQCTLVIVFNVKD